GFLYSVDINPDNVATARTLDDDERPEEIARLLSGSLAVASGVEHARNMLKTRRKSRSARR
ncbi:MAG: hypothetical protein ACO3F0_07735, partial [Ilumatobacteraceae bacterium]